MTKENLTQNSEIQIPQVESEKWETRGFVINRKETVFLRSDYLQYRLPHYFHECGHILGERISFADNTVLQPDEVKQTSVGLSTKEWLIIQKRLSHEKVSPMDQLEEKVAKKVLRVFTKGNYDVDGIKLVNLNDELFQRALDHWKLLGSQKEYEDIDYGIITKRYIFKHLAIELSASAVEKACEMIFANSLHKFGIHTYLRYKPNHVGDCEETYNMVLESYAKEGSVIPSVVDIKKAPVKFARQFPSLILRANISGGI